MTCELHLDTCQVPSKTRLRDSWLKVMGAGKGCVLLFAQDPLLGLKRPKELASYPYHTALSLSSDRAPDACPPKKTKTDRLSQLDSYPGLSGHVSP